MITTSVILFRLVISLLLSAIIGLEREVNNQPAWIRTHILIWVWSCLFMIISIILPEMYESAVSDPGRIAAQVVSWVWFLWAGAIMKIGLNTKGLTTAANIWVTAAIWLAVGAGLYIPAIITAVLILFNLIVISKIKGRFIKKKRYCSINLEFTKMKEVEISVLEVLQRLKIKTITKNIKEDKGGVQIRIIARIHKNLDVYELHGEFKAIKGLKRVSIAENVK